MLTCATCRFFSPGSPAVKPGVPLPTSGECRRYPPAFERRQWTAFGIQTLYAGVPVSADAPACGEHRPADSSDDGAA